MMSQACHELSGYEVGDINRGFVSIQEKALSFILEDIGFLCRDSQPGWRK